MVRRTPYIAATIIKREYQEHREFYHLRMNSAFKSQTNNISIGAFDSCLAQLTSAIHQLYGNEKQALLTASMIIRLM